MQFQNYVKPGQYFMRLERVEAELGRLEAEGIIEIVIYSDWATPIVPY